MSEPTTKVFYDASKLSRVSVVPVPAAEYVIEHAAPSSAFPSDHVAVVVNLDFVQR